MSEISWGMPEELGLQRVRTVCFGTGPERGDLHGGRGQADRGRSREAVLCGACTGRLPRILGTGLGRCWDRFVTEMAALVQG